MDFFIAKKEDINLKNIPKNSELSVISFDRSALDKYRTDQIMLDKGAGELIGDGWNLQIDVGEHHVSTLLYKLATIPDEEIKHFQTKNIWPIPLSATASQRWIKGKP